MAPGASNATAVAQEITRQKLAWQVRIDAIIDQAFEAGMLLPKEDGIRDRALESMKFGIGAAGYEGDIQRIVRAIDDAYPFKRFFVDSVYASLCRTEIERLNFEVCSDLIARIRDETRRSEVVSAYALALYKAGRIEEAEEQLPGVTDRQKSENLSAEIESILRQGGDGVTPAKVRAVEPLLAQIKDPAARAQRRLDIIRRINPQGTLTDEEKSEVAAQLERVKQDLPVGSPEDWRRYPRKGLAVADLLRRLGRYKEAESWIRRQGAEALKNASGWDRMNLLIAMGDLDQALKCLEKELIPEEERLGGLSEIFKENVAGYYAEIAEALFDRNKGREARKLIDKVPGMYREHYKFADAYHGWAKWHLRRGQSEQAVEVLNRSYENPFAPYAKQLIISGAVAQAVMAGVWNGRSGSQRLWSGKGRGLWTGRPNVSWKATVITA